MANQTSLGAGISKQAVLDAQKAWGDGIVAISAVHAAGGDFEARAKQHIETLYAYDIADVMFKPTLASQNQFRGTFDAALSYFIGREGTEDNGFAIMGWTDIRWENTGIYLKGDMALTMGNYFLTGADGNVTKVEYSFSYILDDNNNLRIVLHHSSMPYSPA
ncbi:phosphoribosyl-AMP cyclohydrolase [Epibacterium sp. SM1969]|uniref:Phosphoribosyl-AMP cyclohydrolase n=1 Tax=Tritonibacter aquimaris TaxID=2663379 RepID=A0A844AM91_9RHOB|nr:phosphoribosyl-AMP cyclohydrolase [Tritonibacter aquimaris]MQY43380.1 phosphoribosyl-AMP cyclohydrolase [Tritonibacter aquimaris]